MPRLRWFYPMLGLLLSLVVLFAYYLLLCANLTGQAGLDALAIGYTAAFILSMLLDDDRIMTIAARVCRYRIVSQDDRATAKGSLIVGKQSNILLTAIIDVIAVLFKLMT